MAMAFMIWLETFGSGAAIGIAPIIMPNFRELPAIHKDRLIAMTRWSQRCLNVWLGEVRLCVMLLIAKVIG
ncbi:hypothetical protein D3C85_1575150 [compost metagenome]